jgi:septal ring factor EnvC (AmiA/AmiB activator)
VLLSVFSLLLVGMVVTFVGNSNNYKASYEEQITLNAVMQGTVTEATRQYNELVKKSGELQKNLQDEILNLKAEKDLLASELRKSERLSMQYQNQANSMTSVLAGLDQSVKNLLASLTKTQKELDEARAEGIKSQKELNQMTSDLYEKIVQLQSSEAEGRRLLEQKTELEKQAAMAGTPKEVIAPVTPIPNQMASPAVAAPAGTDIKGLIVEIEGDLVTLSVGSADGVAKNMVFHVTRGDRFVCDVIITNVDINRSAGTLDLVVQQPQVNDIASTQQL